MVNLTFISTFAGCGGSSLGYKMAGYKELLAVDWDNNAVETFKANFPDIPIYHDDIKKLTSEKVMELTGLKPKELDLLDGSPPCQGFSFSGKREFNDIRNSLYKEYVRLIKDLQPKTFVMENVIGLVRGYMKQIYLIIIKMLRDCGYKVKGNIVNAMYYGVPQSRERVIIIGVRNDLNIKPSFPNPKTQPITFYEATKGIENKTFGPPLGPLELAIWNRIQPGERGKKIRPNYYFNFYKVHPNKPCATILKDPKILHWKEKRRLTIEEVKRLFSFPDNFKFIGSFQDQYKRLGNSVPPNLMKEIALHIKKNILQIGE